MTLPLPDPRVDQQSWEQERFGVQRNFDEIAQQFPIGPNQLAAANTVSALPSSPVNGQEVFYVADATNGIVWHLKYRAASGSSYKWEYVGGPPLYAYIDTSQTTSSTSYAALGTAGPSVTVPLAGDYMIRHGSVLTNNTSGEDTFHSYDIGGVGAVDADAVQARSAGATSAPFPSASRSKRKTGLAASTALVSKYRVTNAAAVATIKERWLEVIPVRVG